MYKEITGNEKELYLRGRKLSAFPEQIFLCTSLEKLSLYDNDISVVPEEIGKLIHLKELNISANKLLSIEHIGALKNLEILDLSSNPFTGLPDTLFRLTNLKSLHLWGTSITRLPDEFGNLEHLEFLSIWTGFIPESFGHLQRLKELYVSGENLTGIPGGIGNASCLEKIYLNDTAITTLPESIGRLKKLKILDISNNKQLIHLPASLGECVSLEELHTSTIAQLPEEICHLPHLKVLDLSVKEIPENFGKLSGLESLSIEGHHIREIPASIGQLTTLKTLKIVDTGIDEVPEEIHRLSSLELLHIARNKNLKILPEKIGELKNLKTLFINDNKSLDTLPPSTGKMDSLQDIEITYSMFRELPESMSKLTRLKRLRFAWNEYLTCLPFSFKQIKHLHHLDLRENNSLDLPGWIKDIPTKLFSFYTKKVIKKAGTGFSVKNQEKALLTELDEAASDYQFPVWDTFESLHSITGLMRVNGFKADNGVCLVFELVEYNAGTGAIQNAAVGIGTFPLADWLCNGNGIYVNFYDHFPGIERFTLQPDQPVNVTCREKTFVITVSQDYIDECELYRNSSLKKPPDEAILLFYLCETVPAGYLFSTKAHLKQVFQMPASAEMIFSFDDWNHPSVADILENEIPPGENKTIRAFVKGVCTGKKPELKEEPATGWRKNWKRADGI